MRDIPLHRMTAEQIRRALLARALVSHGHSIENVELLQEALDDKADLAALAAKADLAALDAKADVAAFGYLTADFAMLNQTASQKAFNFSAAGALTLAVGRYSFACLLRITGMDATSGNAAFSLIGAGGATLADIAYQVVGIDSSGPDAVGARSGSISATAASAASMITAGVGVGLGAEIRGQFNVTVAGTIIPSIALVNAAAATMKAGSFFSANRIGPHTPNTFGNWS